MMRQRRNAAASKEKDVMGGSKSSCGANKKVQQQSKCKISRLQKLFGVEADDFKSWQSFVTLLNRPTDPSSLAVFRIVYGLMMVMDIPFERGLAQANYRFGDPEECRFPLFDFITPLPLAWMYMVYLAMVVGAVGIMLGLFYRTSCVMFLVPYWYIFLLDKTVWNNHSYLYGLSAFILLLSDANRYWSLDSLFWPRIRNNPVPLWNYTLLRTQFFLVYFIAGLKKLDPDWVLGYSMQSLSHHWIFSPFTYFLTNEQIDLIMVHHGGLVYDTSVGFLLFFDATRPLGVTMSALFHLMNAQMFSIGMFPFVMLGTMTIFFHVDWPKKLLGRLNVNQDSSVISSSHRSSHCVYASNESSTSSKQTPKAKKARIGLNHQLTAAFTVLYVSTQCFLPYSHFLTPGYNTWTNGLYGYSWDMMIHTWSTQHMRITYTDKHTEQSGYLKPDAWTRGHIRWSSHADMIKQYATCIQDRLKVHGIDQVTLQFDVWRSLNDRFQQRMFDPHVDILTAPWSPWRPTPWLMPLLTDLSHWRKKLDEIEKGIYNSSNEIDVVFMADFPGMTVDNFLQPELGNCSIQILEGQVIVELMQRGKNYTLGINDSLQLPSDEYHNVHTISTTPSCFMYTYVNNTELQLQKDIHKYEQDVADGKSIDIAPEMTSFYQEVLDQRQQIIDSVNSTVWLKLSKAFETKFKAVSRSIMMTTVALKSLATGQSFEAVFNSTLHDNDDMTGY